MKSRRVKPAKRPPPEIEVKTHRARRREQIEQAERTKRRPVFPEPEEEGRYRP